MKFRSDSIADAVEGEHTKHMAALAEEQIKEMHRHNDGSQVELHQVGSREFIQQSIRDSIEGKLGGNSFGNSNDKDSLLQLQNTAKIEYEKKSALPHQLYGSQQSVTGVPHSQDAVMMGCNCGAEWTVTGQSTKQGAESVKVEQYSSPGGQPGGYRISGAGPGEYRAGGGERQDYKG